MLRFSSRIVSALALTWFAGSFAAQQRTPADSRMWRDQSPHRVQFVEVADRVKLEVLDWGGTGRALILLAGSGNTAHVFDDLAPKLTDCCHVYAITRRGYGASSQPPAGYDDQRLADDVLKAIDVLHVRSPVLVGHSMAGGELTTLGRQHSDRLAGLVYLDALGDPRDWPASDPAYVALLKNLPPAPSPPGGLRPRQGILHCVPCIAAMPDGIRVSRIRVEEFVRHKRRRQRGQSQDASLRT
jgi:pimeloyl-ACP methyl ester carboxylesterase